MLIDFPTIRQPLDGNSCLPVCVYSVLTYKGYDVSLDDVSDWCGESVLGCIWDEALIGLRDNGFDVVEILTDHEARMLEVVRGDVIASEPIIITVINPLLAMSGDHAVVVIGFSDDINAVGYPGVYYMDPLKGEIVFDEPGILWSWWSFAGYRAFVVG